VFAALRRRLLCWFSRVYTGGGFNLGRFLDHLYDIDIEHGFVFALYPTLTRSRHSALIRGCDKSSATKPGYIITVKTKLPIHTLFIFFHQNRSYNPEGKRSLGSIRGLSADSWTLGHEPKVNRPFFSYKNGVFTE
jgi:hypothetical protein